MAFKVEEFLNYFGGHSDFAKTSKFDVRIARPNALAYDTADLRFHCEATELPGYNINTVDGRFYGIAQPVASVPTFGDITLTFICAGDLWEKRLFDSWMNLVIPINNYNPRYKDEYVSNKIVINQYYEFDNTQKTAQQKSLGELFKGFAQDYLQEKFNVVLPDKRPSTEVFPAISYSVSLFNAFPVSIAPLTLNWGDDSVHKLAVTFKYDYWTTDEIEYGRGREPAPRDSTQRARPSGSTPPIIDSKSSSSATNPDRGKI